MWASYSSPAYYLFKNFRLPVFLEQAYWDRQLQKFSLLPWVLATLYMSRKIMDLRKVKTAKNPMDFLICFPDVSTVYLVIFLNTLYFSPLPTTKYP